MAFSGDAKRKCGSLDRSPVPIIKQTTHLPHEDGVTPVHHVVDLATLVVDVEGEFFAYDHVPGGAEKVVQSNLDFLCCRSRKQGCITPHSEKCENLRSSSNQTSIS